MSTVKNIITLLIICLFTVAFSWFSTFNLLGVFIDIAPYTVGNSFYLSEILLTFLIYFLGGLLAIKSTKFHPFIAVIPVGMSGLIFYYIELGGFDCIGVCGMPLWYDLISFFKHIAASVFVGVLFLIKKRSRIESSKSTNSVSRSSRFDKVAGLKSVIVLFSLCVVGTLVWGKVLFADISSHSTIVSIYSGVLKEQRNVTVFIPSGYSVSDKSYDVLYTLDGENLQHNYLAVATAKILAYLDFIPEMIIVAVDGQGMRARDFRVKGGVDVFGHESSGDANRFHEFLDNELIPNIERNYRTGNLKMIAGHSYGGLFTAFSFAEHKGSFDGYFSFSPSFQDSNSAISSFKERVDSDFKGKTFIYLNLGLEVGVMRALFKKAEATLNKKTVNNLYSKTSYFSLPHALIMIPGYFEALFEFYRHHEK